MGRNCSILYVTAIIRIRIQRRWYQIVATGCDGRFRLNTWMFPANGSRKVSRTFTWLRPLAWAKFQDGRCKYKCNTEARSRNHCCRWKAISITYSECVFVALGIQRAKRTRHIIICGLRGSTVFFFTFSHKWQDFLRNVLEHTKCVWFSLLLLSETFLILRKIHQDVIKMHRSSCNLHVTLTNLNETRISPTDFRKILEDHISWKSVWWEPSCSMWTKTETDGQTWRS